MWGTVELIASNIVLHAYAMKMKYGCFIEAFLVAVFFLQY